MATIEEILVCQRRWSDAVAAGESVTALVEQSFRGCHAAVACLGSQLVDLGYPVTTFLLETPTDLDARVARIEAQIGVPIPKIIREFWRIVGGIALVDLKDYKHIEFWEEQSIGGANQFCDGVYIDACDDDWLDYCAEDFTTYAEAGDERSFLYSLAPDGYHKDGISGGPAYAIGRGSDWAPTWENFDWCGYRRPETAPFGPTDFMNYLRTALLECAGFPGLIGHPQFESIRKKLIHRLEAF